MKKSLITKNLILIITVLSLGFAACSFLGGGDSGGDNHNRFLINSNNRFVTAGGQGGPRLEYSHTYEGFHFWHFYMGRVDNAPVVPVSEASPAVRFDGVTPVTLEFISRQVTETTVTQSHTSTVFNSVRTVNIQDTTIRVGASLSIPLWIFEAGVSRGFESRHIYIHDHHLENTAVDTYVTMQRWRQENTARFEATIGNYGESPGFYRFALFATFDVYLVVSQCIQTGHFAYDFLTFARPRTLFMSLDFSQTIDGFMSTSLAGRLTFDGTILYNIPAPA